MMTRLQCWLADRMRKWADRIDHAGAPKMLTSLTFTVEAGQGIVVRRDGKGCPLWFYGDDEHERAYSESDTAAWERADRERTREWVAGLLAGGRPVSDDLRAILADHGLMP